MTLDTYITSYAEHNLVPLSTYRAAAALPPLPITIGTETVVGGYFNNPEGDLPDIVLTTEAVHFRENGVWIRIAYTDTYYIAGPEIHGDTIDRRIHILDNTGSTYTLTITGETIRPNYTWALAEYDVWEIWSFLRIVSDRVKIATLQNELVFDAQDAQLVQDFEASMTETSKFDITVAYLLMRWNRFGIEVEQGYRVSIYDYTNDLTVRDLLQRIHHALSAVGAAEIEKYLAPADERFYNATIATAYPIQGSPPQLSWWYRVPKVLLQGLRDDILRWGNGWLKGEISFAEYVGDDIH